ncbi:DUF3592 domain-containing protein [Actinoplanes couchii]|uniref:DUF3592 domain-containing protein n=1 Tax=Actinoplanes couchii TaxID=403638 RepID=A0ABQ3XLA8_9ACTN|nr:DUF3592 domain-containing protein [Actinoplanes couchii]MDR6318342.1 hypothetical protein [Actinoplanes couchii]GID59290.1 hypothetical protein Aco03nite_076940 [Actinoplanes couchii]
MISGVAFVVWFMVGFYLVWAGVKLGWRLQGLDRDGLLTPGTVVRIEQDPRGKSLFAPVVEYSDRAGVRHEFTVGLKAFKPIHPVGATVPVRYFPGRPDTATLGSVRNTVLTIGVPLIVGLACLAAGVWTKD